MEAIFFANEGELWDWYRWHADGQDEIWVGLHKKAARIPSVTIREAMDAAICWGWAESKWMTVDSQRFQIRFTRRKPKVRWSPAVLRRYAELEAEGMVQDAGRMAYEQRDRRGEDQLSSESR